MLYTTGKRLIRARCQLGRLREIWGISLRRRDKDIKMRWGDFLVARDQEDITKTDGLVRLEKRDLALRRKLSGGAKKRRVRGFRNAELARRSARVKGNFTEFCKLEDLLEKKGLFSIRFERHRWRDLDGSTYQHTLARAAVTDMWPMGTSYWLRDNAIIGARFLSSRRKTLRDQGVRLLLSGLSFMSSNAQVDRFKAMLRSKNLSYREDPAHWPYIFADIKTNLSCQRREGWAHKQDAWQIMALHILDALESKKFSRKLITQKHRDFFGLIIPFLVKVECWRCENSGSWEEIPAVRSSVRAWEHRLIVRLGELSSRAEYGFLEDAYRRTRRSLPPAFRRASLSQAVDILDRKLCAAMLRDLPFETPRYPHRDPRYRERDAALFYLLELEYPRFLAERSNKTSAWAKRLESTLLSQMISLQDRASGGIYRYDNDTYQRAGYFSNVTVARLTEMYGGPLADASSNFTGRELILPVGRKAAWTHFIWQLCWWSARRYLSSGERRYRALHERFFRTGLGLVTGVGELTLDVGSDGVSRVVSVPAWRMPECYIAERTPSGRELIIPSPHTPLNWATAEMLHAFTLRRELLSQKDRA